MYRPDVVQLRQFYSSHLGRVVRHYLAQAIRHHWPTIGDDLVLGLGYANPILRHFLPEEKTMQLVPAMPAAQGAIYWPQHSSNRATLVDDCQLPFASNVFNRIVLMHGLEVAEDVSLLLEECWRVLAPGGRMLVVVPNRRGWWASALQTPFSYGHPYHAARLRELMTQARFTPIETSYALHTPPLRPRSIARFASLFEMIGKSLMPRLGGVIVLEVEKQIYAGIKEVPSRSRHRPAYAASAVRPAMTRQ